jgi:hypothetical protein
MLAAVWWGLAWLLCACGQPQRDNPLDPGIPGGQGVELMAVLPSGPGSASVASGLLAEIRFTVSGPDLAAPVLGTMNLVGATARAQVYGVPAGLARVFRVEAFDANHIRTYAAADTVDLQAGDVPVVRLELRRLTGGVEITSELPPEITYLEVVAVAGADTVRQEYQISGMLNERLQGVPTGTDVHIVLTGRDDQAQILLQREVVADVREDLVAHVSLPVETGALQVMARFPEYVTVVPVDRFSDQAGTFFKRSEREGLPAAGAPIDFDRDFLLKGLGPDGEAIEFYLFDVRPTVPSQVYLLVDRRGDPIPGQLPIFDLLPGDPGYSDLWQVHQVRVTDRQYLPNGLTSLQALQGDSLEMAAVDQVMHCVLVPAGSRAAKRFDPSVPAEALDGWYRDQVVKYLLFENPASTATVDLGDGKVNTPQMYAFFENDRDALDGFAVDGQSGSTRNVATRLPGGEGYSPLWVLQVLKLSVFDRVLGLASALDQARIEENIIVLPQLLYLDAPVVSVR